jgi:hypothetical protein
LHGNLQSHKFPGSYTQHPDPGTLAPGT